MRITLIGGHGKIAMLAAPPLVGAGHRVDAVIRNADHTAEVEATGATAVVADVESLDVAGLTDLVSGSDAIVWSAGAGGGSPERTLAVDRDAAIRSIDAAAAAGVPRYVMVSYFGAGPDHGVPADNPFSIYADAKAAADAHLRESDLAWTILGPSALTDDPATGSIDAGGDRSEGAGEVPRADVAAVIGETLRRPELAGRTVEFHTGDVAIADALDAAVRG